MDKNMRRVYEEIIDPQITSVDEIDESDIEIINILKEEEIPYEKVICMKLNPECYYEWSDRCNNCLVIYIPEAYVEKLRNAVPEEFFNISFKLTDLSHEELEKLNSIETESSEINENVERNVEQITAEIIEVKKEMKKTDMQIATCSAFGLVCLGLAFILMMVQLISVAIVILLVGVFFCLKVAKLKKAIVGQKVHFERNVLTPAIRSIIKPIVFNTKGFKEDILDNTVYADLFNYEKFESKNKISINDDGECFVAAEISLINDIKVTTEIENEFKGICVKTKSKKHMKEGLLVDIFTDLKMEKITCQAFKDLFEVSDEIISTEFENKAKELSEKYGVIVSLYYIGDVVYILIDAETIGINNNLMMYQKNEKIVEKIREDLTKKIELVRDYIELAEML